MEFLQNEPVVTKITAAVFVPSGSGAPVHKNRSAHGLAFNLHHSTTYRFSDGRVLTCGDGCCIYLPRGSSYTVDKTEKSSDPGAGVYAINFLLEDQEGGEPALAEPQLTDALLAAFRKAEKAWRQKAPGFREECFSSLYGILKLLRREKTTASRRDKALERLSPALSYINDNYTVQAISLSHLATLCSVSQPYLRRLFHAAFQVSPAVYVRNMRLGYAAELLQTGEYSVTDAALLAGFNDTAYFSREFKKAHGLTPQEYSQRTN